MSALKKHDDVQKVATERGTRMKDPLTARIEAQYIDVIARIFSIIAVIIGFIYCFSFYIFLSIVLFAPAAIYAGTTCTNQHTKKSTALARYGAAYHLVTSAKELLVQGITCAKSSYAIQVGSGSTSRYTYKNSYKWTGNHWSMFNLTDAGIPQGNNSDIGSSTVNITPVSISTYVVGYTCQKLGDASKGGCKDMTCSTSMCQIQKVAADSGLKCNNNVCDAGENASTFPQERSSSGDSVPGKPANKTKCVNLATQGGTLQSAIDAAKKESDKCVYVPPGTFNWGGFITLDGVKLIGDGDTSIIYAPVAKGSRLILTGPNVSLYSLKVRVDIDPQNVVTHADQGGGDLIVVNENASHFVIDDITVTGARSRGILVHGAHDDRITRNRLSTITASPYHIEGGSYNIYVAGNVANWFGDDGVAVCSDHLHPEAATISHDILIENNYLKEQTRGRGLLVHGGKNITFRNNTIIKAAASALMLQPTMRETEPFDVDNILVVGNTFKDSPSVQGDSYTGQVLVKLTGQPYIGLGRVSNVQFNNNKLYSSPNTPFNISPHTGPNIKCSGNTYNGSAELPNNCTNGENFNITGAGIDATILGGTTVPFPTGI